MKKDNILLDVRGVSKSFPGVKALDDVSFAVSYGTIHGLVGENGAGKSTLMKILSGVYKRDEGEIYFDGEAINDSKPIEMMRKGLAIIYQELNLVNSLTVGENIFLGRFDELKGLKNCHIKARELLDSINSKIDTHAYVESLSVSEKQMVEIAKALSFESKLIIMDEPSSSLTNDEIKHLELIIRELKKKGISIIYISHKLDEIFEFCDQVTVMRDGKVIDTQDISTFTRSDMISKMIGRKIENEYPPLPDTVGETILEVSNLNTNKLKDINFSLKKGEILGMVGLVGAGRTEIVRALFGADKAKSIEIKIDGKKTNIRNPISAIKQGMGFVSEDRKQQGLILPFSVKANISMANLKKLKRHGIIKKAEEKKMAAKSINDLAIKTPSEMTKVVSLSGGNQQKCIIARWIETQPRILILDEPTRGIDVGAKYEIYLLMTQIVKSGGAIILISSELPEVLNMSHRVITICDGRITAEADPGSMSEKKIMTYALGLGEAADD